MTLYKTIKWDNLQKEEILAQLPTPIINNKAIGYIGRIDTDSQIKVLNLLNIDNQAYTQHNIMLMYFPPKSSIMIHTDHRPGVADQYQAHQTVIIPLKNCEQTKMGWHEVTNPAGIFTYGEDNRFNPVPNVKKEDTKVLQEIYCTSPFIANIKQWHNVTNEGNETAIGITLRLFPWSTAMDLSNPPIPNITVL